MELQKLEPQHQGQGFGTRQWLVMNLCSMKGGVGFVYRPTDQLKTRPAFVRSVGVG
jgi:hypothetical protein